MLAQTDSPRPDRQRGRKIMPSAMTALHQAGASAQLRSAAGWPTLLFDLGESPLLQDDPLAFLRQQQGLQIFCPTQVFGPSALSASISILRQTGQRKEV